MEPYRFIPSERTAMTIEEFLEVCRAEPTLAADQLHGGYFEPWLRDAGRPDLAEAAAQVRQTDFAPASALEQFLQAATLAPARRRRRRRMAGARAAGGRVQAPGGVPEMTRVERLFSRRWGLLVIYAFFLGAYLIASGPRLRGHSAYNHFVYLAEGWLDGRLAMKAPPQPVVKSLIGGVSARLAPLAHYVHTSIVGGTEAAAQRSERDLERLADRLAEALLKGG